MEMLLAHSAEAPQTGSLVPPACAEELEALSSLSTADVPLTYCSHIKCTLQGWSGMLKYEADKRNLRTTQLPAFKATTQRLEARLFKGFWRPLEAPGAPVL